MKKRLKESTVKQLLKLKPALPPRRLLKDVLDDALYLLSGLSLGKLQLSDLDEDITDVCRKGFMLDKEMDKPEVQDILDKEDLDLVAHFVNNLNSEGFQDMMQEYGDYLKDDGVADDVADTIIERIGANRIKAIDVDNKGDA